MKKKVAIVLLSILLIASFGCSSNENDFDKVNIHMPRAELLAQNENNTLKELEDKSLLCSDIRYLSLAGDVVYSFDEQDALAEITYLMYPDFCNTEGLKTLKNSLLEKYEVSVTENEEGVSADDGLFLQIRYAEEEYLILTVKR